jgi:hypothetical protein
LVESDETSNRPGTSPGAPSVPGGARNGTAAVPIRDVASGLTQRLAAFDPRRRGMAATQIRAETVAIAAMAERLAHWRALIGAAELATPALEPSAIRPVLAADRRLAARVRFLCLWADETEGRPLRSRRLIALLPFDTRKVGPGLAAGLPWSPPGPWPAPMLVHRHYGAPAARALAAWLGTPEAGIGALVLRDLPAGGDFARALPRGHHVSPELALPVLAIARDGPPARPHDAPGDLRPTLWSGVREVDVDRFFALDALWRGAVTGAGELTWRAASEARIAAARRAAAEGRIALVWTERGPRVLGAAMAERAGAAAALIGAICDPALAPSEGVRAKARSLGFLIARLKGERALVAVQAGDLAADPTAAQLLPGRAGLVGVALTHGAAGAVLGPYVRALAGRPRPPRSP